MNKRYEWPDLDIVKGVHITEEFRKFADLTGLSARFQADDLPLSASVLGFPVLILDDPANEALRSGDLHAALRVSENFAHEVRTMGESRLVGFVLSKLTKDSAEIVSFESNSPACVNYDQAIEAFRERGERLFPGVPNFTRVALVTCPVHSVKAAWMLADHELWVYEGSSFEMAPRFYTETEFAKALAEAPLTRAGALPPTRAL